MGGLGQAAGDEGDHGPQDHGFVAGWEPTRAKPVTTGTGRLINHSL